MPEYEAVWFDRHSKMVQKSAPCRAEENDRWAARREAYYRLACLQLEEKRSPVHDAFDPVESNDSNFSPTDGGLW